MSNFSHVPQVRMNRSRFDLSKGVKTSMSVGRLYPIDIQEILPGDTFKNKTVAVARVTSSFLKPVMDNAYMDIFHFFVPYRLCYKDAERVFGNPNPSAYVNTNLRDFPSFDTRQTCLAGTVADYLGLPLGQLPKGISILPFRAFALIYNNWFRNQSTVGETYVQDGELASSESLNANEWSPNNYTGLPPFVSKKNDYFTSALPQPQKGEPIKLDIGTTAPVIFTGDTLTGLTFNQKGIDGNLSLYANASSPGDDYSGNVSWLLNGNNIQVSGEALYPNDGQLVADLTSAGGLSINEQRFAFQLQKMLEKDARYGSRYNEYLLGHFGVSSPDSRLQIPEFLGGGRIPISVQQVAQTSAGTEESPLAEVGAFSLSNGKSRFTKSFVEHGYVITCACIRTMHTYQQGVNKMWSRTSRNDFYDPLFANLGEQPIYEAELFAEDSETFDERIFGYNEAWADYRYSPSRISGQMRSKATNSLDIWHFGDDYQNAPTLTPTFTNETSQFFDRTLSVPSNSLDNFICDFWFDTKATRVMPLYSVPGLIDHH